MLKKLKNLERVLEKEAIKKFNKSNSFIRIKFQDSPKIEVDRFQDYK